MTCLCDWSGRLPGSIILKKSGRSSRPPWRTWWPFTTGWAAAWPTGWRRAPVRPFKEVELQTIIRYYDMYQTVMDHPVSRFIQRHRLHKVAKWSWAAFNYSSPFYWGRQAAYELGRRLLLARIADLVGEEAMRLYGRRR